MNWFNSQEIYAILAIVQRLEARLTRVEAKLNEALIQNAALQELTDKLKASSDALKQVVDTTKVG